MPNIALSSIPHSLMLKVSKKLWLREIARLRRTCHDMDTFFSENHLRITADCPHKLEIYPRLSDEGKMETVSFRTTSLINENSMELYDPKKQTEAANFNTIEIAVMKMCYNFDADCDGECKDKCLKSLLNTVKLSCNRLILTGCVEEPSLWDAVHLFQRFQAVEIKRATVDKLATLPESCRVVDVHTLDNFPSEEILYRFDALKIGCFTEGTDGTSDGGSLEEEVDTEFDNFMLALRQARDPGNLRFLQVPCLFENDSGGIRQLDCNRFGLTKIYDGERFQKTLKANCHIYLMDFTAEHIPIVIIKETPVHGDFEEVYEVMIIENDMELLSDAIGTVLFRDYPLDNSILREGFEGKNWDEYSENINRYFHLYTNSDN